MFLSSEFRQQSHTLNAVPAFIDPLRRRLPRPVSILLIVIAGISGGLLVFWRWDWLLDNFGWPTWLHLDAAIRVAAAVVSGMVVVLAAVRLLYPTAISRLRVATGRRLSRTSLLTAILLAVGAGVGLAVLFNWAIGEFAGLKAEETPRIEVTRTALAGVAGIGGAVALVVAYRRQRDIEQGRFVERFGAAAAQLGDHDVAVRIAGVYAMAGVADESTRLRRQQCIDVLCGYLRLPYDPEHGSSHRTDHVLTKSRARENSHNQC